MIYLLLHLALYTIPLDETYDSRTSYRHDEANSSKASDIKDLFLPSKSEQEITRR